jgi:hypothetical protein
VLLEYPEFNCSHEFLDDWTMGGHYGGDVRADPRWKPTTYEFLDEKLARIHIGQGFTCDHEALLKYPQACVVIATRDDGTPEMLLNKMG